MLSHPLLVLLHSQLSLLQLLFHSFSFRFHALQLRLLLVQLLLLIELLVHFHDLEVSIQSLFVRRFDLLSLFVGFLLLVDYLCLDRIQLSFHLIDPRPLPRFQLVHWLHQALLVGCENRGDSLDLRKQSKNVAFWRRQRAIFIMGLDLLRYLNTQAFERTLINHLRYRVLVLYLTLYLLKGFVFIKKLLQNALSKSL